MRIALLYASGFWNDIYQKLVDQLEPELLLWASNDPIPKLPKGAQAELINRYFHAFNSGYRKGYFFPDPYGEEYQLSKALSAEEIDWFLPNQSTVLRMLDRCPGAPSSFEDRKWWYLRKLSFYKGFFEHYQPTHFVSKNFPHVLDDYLLYSWAQKLNVPFYFVHQLQFKNRSVLSSDMLKEPQRFLKWKEPSFYNASSKISDDFVSYKKQVRESFQTAVPFYIEGILTQFKKERSPLAIFRELLKKVNFKFVVALLNKEFLFEKLVALKKKLKTQVATSRMIEEYDRLVDKNLDLSVPYIFYALHYQPEATTCPFAGHYVDQELCADLLAAVAKKYSVKIYLKEHPVQTSFGRYSQFYKYLSRHENIHFVARDFPSEKLLKNAKAVASSTGTVILEALMLKIPALVFGHYFNRSAPNAFPIDSESDLEQAFTRIVKENFEVKEEAIDAFLYNIQEESIVGNSQERHQKKSELSDQENVEYIVKALLSEMQNA